MTLTQPLGLLALALAIPVLALHVLRPLREARVVSTTLLWDEVHRPTTASAPWQRLRWSRLLLLQLLAVALFAVALSRPVRPTAAPLAGHTVFVLDVSGSMAARDGRPDRLSAAKDEAKRLRAQLPAGGSASLVTAGPFARLIVADSRDRRSFDAALDAVTAVAGPADWDGAFAITQAVREGQRDSGVVLLSDGRLPPEAQRAVPAGATWRKAGSRSVNRAIVRLTAEPRGERLHARAVVRNTGGPSARQVVRFDVDGRTERRVPVRIGAGAEVTAEADLPTGDRVEAFLEGGADLLPSDGRAYAVSAPRRSLRVLLTGAGDPFLARMLAAIPGVAVEERSGPRSAPDGVAAGYDLAVFDRVAVPAQPGAPFLAIAPPAGAGGIAVIGTVDDPVATLVENRTPLLSGLDLSGVAIARAQRLQVDPTRGSASIETVIAAEETPLLLVGVDGARRFAYLGFAFEDSTLPLQVAFPILGDRLVRELTGIDRVPPDVRVGEPIPLTGGAAVTVISPDGRSLTVPVGAAAPIAEQAGFWRVLEGDRPERLIAVNPDAAESVLEPASSLPIAAADASSSARLRGERSLLPWVLGALAIVLAVEWFESRRHRGVPRRQWRAAVATRAALAGCLGLALLAPSIPRTGRGVAVLFVIDGSDSLGAGGQAQAGSWVAAALRARPDGARAGVVQFGANAVATARLGRPGTEATAHDGRVAGSETRVGAALRLAGAVLPASARRRVVVVSDGRFTDGGATDEARRLRDAGVRVDVVPVERVASGDAAVTRVEVPAAVHVGEVHEVRAVVSATVAGPAVVSLFRDDAAVERRPVELVEGDQVVSFTQGPVRDADTLRYRVEVRLPGDAVPQNDLGFAAATVEGPSRVLVVEGEAGAADALVAALRAEQLDVSRADARALPGLETLAGFASTVLVNVDARQLSGAEFDALTVASRDLGKGLVVIGGTQAFGLGGYRRSPLEALLPVESDILDPKRRLRVAEVLAIDTSGSMGACHCANGVSARIGGGVDKTDISRSAAAQAIAALSANDHVGVLAFDVDERWVLPVQPVPAAGVVRDRLAALSPEGGTVLDGPLLTAAAELRKTDASLKHVVLFTDGFTDPESLARLQEEATALGAEGITVSVLATGEGSADELRAVAEAGRGRFYPGTDLLSIPEIMADETVIASRSFVNEGRFIPQASGSGAAVSSLATVPPILGYVATTAKPTAQTLLRVGPLDDPLLSTWRAGLGRVTAWTSDAATRWSQLWAGSEGYARFWAAVVRETFPLGGGTAASIEAEPRGRGFRVVVDAETAWPDGATADLFVAEPGATRADAPQVRLERVSPTSFAADVEALAPGTYGLGAVVTGADGRALSTPTRLVSQAYAAEYRPGRLDRGALERLAAAGGGRVTTSPGTAFRADGLPAGRSRLPLTGVLLGLAAVLFPVDVALRRLLLRASPGAAPPGGRGPRRRPRHLASAALAALGSRVRPPKNAPWRAGAPSAPRRGRTTREALFKTRP